MVQARKLKRLQPPKGADTGPVRNKNKRTFTGNPTKGSCKKIAGKNR